MSNDLKTAVLMILLMAAFQLTYEWGREWKYRHDLVVAVPDSVYYDVNVPIMDSLGERTGLAMRVILEEHK